MPATSTVAPRSGRPPRSPGSRRWPLTSTLLGPRLSCGSTLENLPLSSQPPLTRMSPAPCPSVHMSDFLKSKQHRAPSLVASECAVYLMTSFSFLQINQKRLDCSWGHGACTDSGEGSWAGDGGEGVPRLSAGQADLGWLRGLVPRDSGQHRLGQGSPNVEIRHRPGAETSSGSPCPILSPGLDLLGPR